MNYRIHLFNWFIPALMKSCPDGICLHGFHYSDLNKLSHCYGTLQSPRNRQKLRAWCSRLSPQAAIPTQISSKRCLLKISTLNQLRTLNFGKSVMKTWKKCDKTRPLHFFLTIANGGSCHWEAKADLSDPVSAALAEVGTCTLPGAQRRTRICITAPPRSGSTSTFPGLWVNITQMWNL